MWSLVIFKPLSFKQEKICNANKIYESDILSQLIFKPLSHLASNQPNQNKKLLNNIDIQVFLVKLLDL